MTAIQQVEETYVPPVPQPGDGRSFDHSEGWRSAGITVETMRKKLLTVEHVRDVLRTTEPFGGIELNPDGTRFRLANDWWVGLEQRRGSDLVECFVTVRVGGVNREYQFTLDAFLEATSFVGLPKTYVTKTPGSLVQSHLDYWFSSPDRPAKLLNQGDTVLGLAKATLRPFSNVAMLDRAVGAVNRKYGTTEDDIYVDYKMQHSIRRTSMMLVVPEARRAIRQGDDWSGGVTLTNSLTGETATTIDGFLFRWWCTNGAISRHNTSGKYSRRGAGNDEEQAYDWTTRSVTNVLGQMEGDFDRVEALANEPIEGEVNATLNSLFDNYRMPQVQREAIRAEMMEVGDLTMYGLMQAVTSAANRRGLRQSVREDLMSIGGDLVRTQGRCAHCLQVQTPHAHD